MPRLDRQEPLKNIGILWRLEQWSNNRTEIGADSEGLTSQTPGLLLLSF